MARKPRPKTESDILDKPVDMSVEGRLSRLEADLEESNYVGAATSKDVQLIKGRIEQLKNDLDEISEGASAEDLAQVQEALARLGERFQSIEEAQVAQTADMERGREEQARASEENGALKTKIEELEGSLTERLDALKEEVSQSSAFLKTEDFEKAQLDQAAALEGVETKIAAALKSEDFEKAQLEHAANLESLEQRVTNERQALRTELDSVHEALRSDLDGLRREFDEKVGSNSENLSKVTDDLRSEFETLKSSLDGADTAGAKLKEAFEQVKSLQERIEEVEPKYQAAATQAAEADERVAQHLDAIKMAMRLVEQLEARVNEIGQNAQAVSAAAANAAAAAPALAAAATTAATAVVSSAQAVEVIDDEPIPVVAEDLGYDLADILQVVVKHNASDLHLKAGTPPTVRLHGDLVPVGNQVLSPTDSKALIYSAMSKDQRRQLSKGREVDFAYTSEGTRFRVNAFLERGQVSAAFRMLRTDIPSLDSLGLPPVLKKLGSFSNGLILVTGPAGSGKSTTLAALLDYINSTRKCHIVTVEDPIEFFHKDKLSIVTQREVGTDTADFSEALRMSLRQDPNVIMVGEMRDPETILMAVTAAETGHLVLSTLHTPNAVQAVDRIIDTFSGDVQRQFRLLLANSLRGVLSQKLLNRADGKGRVVASEVMVVTPTISSLILEGKTQDIYPYIQQGANDGMQTFTQSMLGLYTQGLISKDEGLFHADQPTEFRLGAEGHATETSTDISDETLMNWL